MKPAPPPPKTPNPPDGGRDGPPAGPPIGIPIPASAPPPAIISPPGAGGGALPKPLKSGGAAAPVGAPRKFGGLLAERRKFPFPIFSAIGQGPAVGLAVADGVGVGVTTVMVAHRPAKNTWTVVPLVVIIPCFSMLVGTP